MLERQILIGLVAGGSVLALVAWGRHGYAERDKLAADAQQICATAQSDYAPAKETAGVTCRKAIAELARFKVETNAASAEILAGAMADATTRNTKAAEQARQAADAARAAAQHMEAVDAAVEDDRVGRAWFDALNRAGGLRDKAER
ncbi:hypothetical protein [Caulobacter segnis]|uniref:Uncharacterized protein n=1 Tax=Caulobacter segnis TaxID=88688 RepID=A0A2W5VGZ7_9CAUL|nr:hypothetical protein [Caulobacter segnis]PZR37173.1 MAG: hypothetical protein DI526_01260 [Caulobacter segnis]